MSGASPTNVELLNSGLTRQITSTIMISLMTLNAGMATGWVTPMTTKLKGNDSPVGAMEKHEISLLATLPGYLGFFLSFFYGFVATKFGRKEGLMCVGIPSIVSGIVLTYAKSKVVLYIGRSFAGASIVGGINMSTLYVSEIVHDSIRGMLITLCLFQLNVGILLSSVLGKILSYQSFNCIGIVLPTIYTAYLLYLPESPHFLLTQRRIKDAMRALTWLRGSNYKAAKLELENIKPANAREKLSYHKTFKSKGALTALLVSILAFIFQSGSGIHAIREYAENIFEKSSGPISQNESSIIISLLMVTSSLMGLFLIDMIGRKPLLYLSFIGGSISLAILSSFLCIEMKGSDVRHFTWIPVSCVIVFVIVYAVGLSAIPNVLTNELSPAKVKPAISSLASAAALAITLMSFQSFPYLDEYVGTYFAFCIPVLFNTLGAFYTWFMVPETKEKSLRAIVNELNDKKYEDNSQRRTSRV